MNTFQRITRISALIHSGKDVPPADLSFFRQQVEKDERETEERLSRQPATCPASVVAFISE